MVKQNGSRTRRSVQPNKNPNSVGCRDDLRRIRDREATFSREQNEDVGNPKYRGDRANRMPPVSDSGRFRAIPFYSFFLPLPIFHVRLSSFGPNNIHVDIIRTRSGDVKISCDTYTYTCRARGPLPSPSIATNHREYVGRSGADDPATCVPSLATWRMPFPISTLCVRRSQWDLVIFLFLHSCFFLGALTVTRLTGLA